MNTYIHFTPIIFCSVITCVSVWHCFYLCSSLKRNTIAVQTCITEWRKDQANIYEQTIDCNIYEQTHCYTWIRLFIFFSDLHIVTVIKLWEWIINNFEYQHLPSCVVTLSWLWNLVSDMGCVVRTREGGWNIMWRFMVQIPRHSHSYMVVVSLNIDN